MSDRGGERMERCGASMPGFAAIQRFQGHRAQPPPGVLVSRGFRGVDRDLKGLVLAIRTHGDKRFADQREASIIHER